MDKTKIIDKLNDILRWEWTGVAQYAQHSFIVKGLLREVYAKLFEEGAEESFGHAKRIGAKITALGGVPSLERGQVKQSEDLVELLQYGLEFERGAVKLYCEALELAEGDRALVVLLENILLDEQDGVDHLERLLIDAKSGTISTGKKAVG